MRETSRLVEQTETDSAPTIVFRVNPNLGGDTTVLGELAVTRLTLFQRPKPAW